jgi:thiamine pyrophosphate-dependent acetolactate synthase large subunit-like protein
MAETLRGADIVIRALEQQGVARVFTLSGNHIMSLFDAALGRPIDLVHVRHEAAAVHMADAWGRLTGDPGVAMVTGGPGHANAVGALFTALGAESPMVLLSGHAATWELGRGGFQELDQAAMAAPVTKASWMARSTAALAEDVGRAIEIARSGRPGPVHLSLPSDLLDEDVSDDLVSWPEPRRGLGVGLHEGIADAVLAALQGAARPVILAGPRLSSREGRTLLAELEQATRVPAVVLESPRGVADATIGAFSEIIRRADLVVLLGKALDFTVRWLEPPVADKSARVIVLDPDGALVARAAREKGERLLVGAVADSMLAARTLIVRAKLREPRPQSWLAEARVAIDARPRAWDRLASTTPGKLHPIEVFRALGPVVTRDPASILICDGGEFAQWGQCLLKAPRRIINSVTGAIGAGLPFALAARVHDARAPVFAVMGDGTFGFHMAEIETAVRRKLPFVAIVGNDACWNAESQLQRRDYGENRMHGCELLPARYDLLASALGGHGELVEAADQLDGAIARAIASGKPAIINVMTESIAAPVLKRES